MKRYTPAIGDKVTIRQGLTEEAYYSRYAGNPECTFSHGMIGTVAAVDVPPVRGTPANKWGKIGFTCVDFYVDGKPYNPPHNDAWRCAIYPKDLVLIERA